MGRLRSWWVWSLAALFMLPLVRGSANADPQPAVEQLISPDEMLSVDQVHPGMKGVGKSVFVGTKIETFNVTVLGVLRKIDFGGDMILIRINDGPPVTSGSGVSAGMSGSPIYVDGKLIGALAFAWPFAKDPVAGVTPIAQMLENYRPGSAPKPALVAQSGDLKPDGGPLQLDGKLFARASVVPDAGLAPRSGDGTLYLAPVATPIMVSGMGRSGLDALKRRFSRYSSLVMAGPGHTDLPAAERPKIEPGSAVGVQLMGGDVDSTAIGTVTYVKGNHVVAFGHPMFGIGTIDLPMTTAYIHGIISSQEVSFKMGSPIETVGRVMQDRNWSIGGQMGSPSPTIQAEFVITDKDRGVHRDYKVVSAVHRDLTPMLLYGALLNAVSSVSPPTTGTTRGVVEVWAKGIPGVRRENVFAMGERKSQIEQLFADPMAGMPLAELLQILDVLENNTFGSVPVEHIRVAVDISEKRETASIERAYADRKVVKPGEKVKIGVVFQPVNAPRQTREYEVEIPRNIPGGKVQIGVSGGASAERIRQAMQITRPQAKSLPQLLGQISGREQNNELNIEIAQTVAGVAVSGREFPNLPTVVVEVLTGANPSGIRMIRSHTRRTESTPWVLSGAQLLTLQVDADEKDKSGPATTFGASGGAGLGSLLDLFKLGLGGGEAGAGDLSGELSGDGASDDGASIEGAAALSRLFPLAAGRRPFARDPGSEPAMPSFDELQRILEGSGPQQGGGAEGGAVTPPRKGVGRGPGVWRMTTAKDFQPGKLDGVLVSSRGELALAPKADALLTSPDRFFWAQATDRAGTVYAGSWLDGGILKITADGKTSRLLGSEADIAISAVAADPDGTVYAAAEPTGAIYRIEPSGAIRELARIPDHRIWALRRSGDSLYAGTGSEGGLYRIAMDGKVSLVFTAPDRHVFALAADGKGTLYCGTYPRGKVFRVRDGKAEPLYELPASTVTALACDGNGNVYVGTSPHATVVKLTPDGVASVVFQSAEKHVFSLLVGDEGTLTVATGPQAHVYRVAADRTVSTLWAPQAAYVLSLSRDDAGNLYATTAGPTQIVRLTAATALTGTYTSAPLNAGNSARWGRVRWTGSTEGVKIQTRTGSTAYPDATWSDWSEAYTKAVGQPISSPVGQYLQYRVLLQTGPTVPSLRSLDLFYRPRNRAPEVTLKSPAAGDVLSGTRPIRWVGKDPDGDRLRYEVYYAREGTDTWTKIGSRTSRSGDEDENGADLGSQASALPHSAPPALHAAKPVGKRHSAAVPLARGTRQVAAPAAGGRRRPVQASAGKGQSITITLPSVDDANAVESESGSDTDSSELGEGGASLTWNTRKVPDGRYRLKVVATDALTCPDEPATAEAISEAVLVDNTAPVIPAAAAKRVGLAPPLTIPVRDSGTYLASAEYRVDEGEWIAAAAADGIFDSAEELVRIDRAMLKPGHHALFVRVRDAAGNEATTRIVYTLARPAAPKK